MSNKSEEISSDRSGDTISEKTNTPEDLTEPDLKSDLKETVSQAEPDTSEPKPYLLNFAYQFPENSGTSYAESFMKDLIIRDSKWFSEIYNLAGSSPSAIAARLGRPVSSILGNYDPDSKNQDPEDPSTWKPEHFSQANVSFSDAGGNFTSAASNAQDIISMASVYAYYNEITDPEVLESYIRSLWKASHSYKITMGEVYYCDGCIDPNPSLEGNHVGENSAERDNAESMGQESTEPAVFLNETDSNAQQTIREADHLTEEDSPAPNRCPGHIDLRISAQIITLGSGNALFKLDRKIRSAEENGWFSWNRHAKSLVRHLSQENWNDRYGLQIIAEGSKAPLSETEIASYVKALPADLSESRKNIIRFALGSVGKVPYYWGGKANRANYSGNNFGTITEPDYKGRILKGLDCSGWISWVYWSANGERLPYESTDGLKALGRAVSRQELKPGDLIIMDGEDSHAVMFMNWAANGQIQCIHESSAGGNVAISTMAVDWPYYRSLLD